MTEIFGAKVADSTGSPDGDLEVIKRVLGIEREGELGIKLGTEVRSRGNSRGASLVGRGWIEFEGPVDGEGRLE